MNRSIFVLPRRWGKSLLLDPMGNVDLQTIAKAVGLAKSTVSMALNGNPKIAIETRHLVQKVAVELGYRPNPILSALGAAARKTAETPWNIGFLWDANRKSDHVTQLYEKFARMHALRLGYQMETVMVRPQDSPRHITQILRSRGVAGVILAPSFSNEAIQSMDFSQFSTVACEYGDPIPGVPVVGSDFFSSIRLAWHKVKENGYQRIGFSIFTHKIPILTDQIRVAAANHFGGEKATFVSADFECEDAFIKWFSSFQPDAVISLVDTPYWWLKDNGVSIPDALGFVVINLTRKKYSPKVPTFAGLSPRRDKIAQGAVEMLDNQIRRGRKGLQPIQKTTLIQSEWFDGESLPARVS